MRQKTIFNDLKKNYSNSMLYQHYKLLSCNLFKWSNLPNNIKSRYIEERLFEFGSVGFYEDDDYGFMALQSEQVGYNVYNEPVGIRVVGNGHTRLLNPDNCVEILNNSLRIPTAFFIDYFISQLTELDLSIQMNVKQQKFPLIITCTKENELTMKNIIKKVYNNELSITVDREINERGGIGINALKTGIPFVADKLQEQKYEVEKNLLSFLGINTSVEKKERLLLDEVNSNNSYISMNLDVLFEERKKACELINKKYNFNPPIKVERTLESLETLFNTSLEPVKEKELKNE